MTEIPDTLRVALSDEVLEASRDAYCNKRDELIDIYGTLTVDALASAQRQALEAQREFLLTALAPHWPQYPHGGSGRDHDSIRQLGERTETSVEFAGESPTPPPIIGEP